MKAVLLLLLVGLIACVPHAQAFTPLGGPIEGNSWSQAFREYGVGSYDFMRVDWISGGRFESPAFSAFSVGGWSLAWEGPLWAAAEASIQTTSDMTFYLKFQGNPADQPEFYFSAWLGDTWRETASAKYNGASWIISSSTWKPDNPREDPGVVPEPLTVVLIASGLAGSALLQRRRRSS